MPRAVVWTRIRQLLFGSQLRRNAAGLALAAITNSVASLIIYPIAIGYLGYRDYGIWLALSVAINVTQLGQFGFSAAVAKLVAHDWSLGLRNDAAECIASAQAGTAVSAGLVGGAALLGWKLVAKWADLPLDVEEAARAVLPGVILISVYSLFTQVTLKALAGVGRSDLSGAAMAGGKLVTVGTSWFLLARGYGLHAMLGGLCIGTFCSHLGAEFVLWRAIRRAWWRPSNVSRRQLKRLLGYGIPVFGNSILLLVMHPFNRIILAASTGMESLPVFELAWAAGSQLRNLFAVALQALLPDFSAAFARRDFQGARRLLRRTTGFLAIIAVPGAAALAAAAPLAFRLWVGAELQPGTVLCFQILTIGFLASLLAVPSYYLILGSGSVGDSVWTNLIQTVGTAALAIALTALQLLNPGSLSGSIATAMFASALWTGIRAKKLAATES